MREHYQQELNRLNDELYLLGNMVSIALRESVEALKSHNQELATQIIVNDRLVNSKRYRIEEDCLILMATQAPMARDIARITQYIGRAPHVKPLTHIPQMCELSLDMLRRSLDAFVNNDVIAARQIPREDDQVDALYNTVNKELIDIIVQDPRKVDNANYLSWVAHNLERSADRVTNICERVIYTVTGELIELDHLEPELSGTN